VPKLNQVIAAEKSVKGRAQARFTEAYHQLQKLALLTGITKSYAVRDEDGEQLPPEKTLVQVRVPEVLNAVQGALTEMFDLVATKDRTNCKAKADVVVDGRVLLAGMPVATLLFLEKQLVDLRTVVGKIPVLDAAEVWHFDRAVDAWATQPVQTIRTKKVPRNHVKAPATDKHPAQVEVYFEDTPVGTWSTTRFSGAMPASRVRELLDRIDTLATAVKFAREEANSIEVMEEKIGAPVFGYLFGEPTKTP
jgi:hypothetical protein